MQAVPSTYHQCVKFPYNGTEVVIPGDHTIAINALVAAEKFVPHNEPSVDPSTSLVAAEKSLKMMSLGMGEYTLGSFASIPVSPRSYGKPSDPMKPSTSAMTIFDTFVPPSIPLEAEQEEQAVQEWIYRDDSRNTPMLSNSDTDTDESPLHTMA
ncbi:hypothetical protein, partial [[Clostridium] innocuum]|uniref:hypothetical protein n=1 Tax=Clostridium innocuum TaxID=1522 RepID=UPI0012DFF98F